MKIFLFYVDLNLFKWIIGDFIDLLNFLLKIFFKVNFNFSIKIIVIKFI